MYQLNKVSSYFLPNQIVPTGLVPLPLRPKLMPNCPILVIVMDMLYRPQSYYCWVNLETRQVQRVPQDVLQSIPAT